MFVGKQFDIVMGVDIHIIQPPGPVPPIPIPHPFMGIVFDPAEFVPLKGFNVMVNGIPRGQGGSAVKMTVPHIPIGGTFVKPPTNDGELYMGADTIGVENEPFAYMGLPVLSCQDVGSSSPERENRKVKGKKRVNMSPVSILLPVPKGGKVGVGLKAGRIVKKNACPKMAKKYKKNRPKYAAGQEDSVWSSSQLKKGKNKGKVRCPNCKKLISRTPRKEWHMGHLPGKEYKRDVAKFERKSKKSCKQREKEFKKKYKDPKNYQVECAPCNVSHKFEKK